MLRRHKPQDSADPDATREPCAPRRAGAAQPPLHECNDVFSKRFQAPESASIFAGTR